MLLAESTFDRLLNETVVWATPRIAMDNPQWCLRSPELRPPYDYYDDDPGLFNEPKLIDYVTDTRSNLLTLETKTRRREENAGRLLLVEYNATNHNDATKIESDGFFDFADNPPWDLWVCGFGDNLIGWIPNQFVSVVAQSMNVECIGMLHWIDSNDEEFKYPDWLVRHAIGG